MLDNLVESKNNSESTARRGGYLLTTSVLVFSLFASGILWSLFAKDLNMGSDSMELSSMVAPVPMPESEPPPPEVIKEIKQDNSAKQESSLPVRQVNMAQVNEPFVPDKVSSAPVAVKARPNTAYVIGKTDEDPTNGVTGTKRIDGENTGQVIQLKPREVEKTEEEPPPTIKKIEPKAEIKESVKPKAGTTVSKGVINGTATSLPKPAYPPAAKAIRVSGDVSVQVTIDEQGNVISANAVSGHALLKQVSEQAARSAKFKPTLLSNQPVKVTGIIVYKFTAQ
ncbi:MAG: TonB family protein [Acidobacteriota bacterium]